MTNRSTVQNIKKHMGLSSLIVDAEGTTSAIPVHALCDLALKGLESVEPISLPSPSSHTSVAPSKYISDAPQSQDADALQAFLADPRTREVLRGMAHEIATQNVRATSHPMYCVRTKRVEVYETADSDASGVTWRTEDGTEAEGELLSALQDAFDAGGGTVIGAFFDENGKFRSLDGDNDLYDDAVEYTRYGTITHYEVVTTFFTNKSAEDYIEANKHNLRDPHVYVDSGYRNYEWQFMRALILALGKTL